MNEPARRPVWLTHADVSWLHTSEDTPQRREALTRLNVGFNSAPADPYLAVREALRDHVYLIVPRELAAKAACEALGWEAPA